MATETETCKHPYRDRHGIERRCQKPKGHSGKHGQNKRFW